MGLLWLLLLALAGAASAGDAPAPGANPLEPFAYLVGGAWTAQGEHPGIGPYTADRTYRWIVGGKFIEQHHAMRFAKGDAETRGVIGWDAEKKVVVAWGFGSDGGIAVVRAVPVTPTEIRFEGERTGGLDAGPIRATFRKISDREFEEIAEVRKGDAWEPMVTFRFVRGL